MRQQCLTYHRGHKHGYGCVVMFLSARQIQMQMIILFRTSETTDRPQIRSRTMFGPIRVYESIFLRLVDNLFSMDSQDLYEIRYGGGRSIQQIRTFGNKLGKYPLNLQGISCLYSCTVFLITLSMFGFILYFPHTRS